MQRRNAARHTPTMYVKTARPDPLVRVELVWAGAVAAAKPLTSGSGIGIAATQQRTSLGCA
jgi:hypothetical protein